MTAFLGEFIGTTILVLLGEGVCANVILKDTKGSNSGWIVITMGWGMAVFVAVFSVGAMSGAHINPAVTLGLAIAGKFAWSQVPMYIIAQMLGAGFGAFWVWLAYKDHFVVTENQNGKLGVFATGPEIRNYLSNFTSEVIGTVVLVFCVLLMAEPDVGLGALNALPVGFLVLSIGLSLGGTTGYAINPARDLGPRIIYSILPIPNKRDADWSYSWVPVLGPLTGGIIAAALYVFTRVF